ncbi:sensor histidine kinase [Cognatilysobacter lacus]|uniref:histidine kinase n=1 Tax=Cognatilysobacter lacus TaxID=1643323 RepID=A0A5D8Z4M0_9GAMM|nr:HAMP domain-containing sensor histidine kinase [Lysobacter lacus]TZF89711.1 HAMP domain-containing histidine kinase [Lysobacter lacus]
MTDENDRVRRQLDDARAQIDALNAELAETNNGVVALYTELDDQAEQLRQVSELKSRFLSYMSHEFRTPLVSIQSMGRLLVDRLDGPLSDEQERQVRFIQEAAAELSEMVDDLLDLAKVEAGRITVSPDWFELIDLFSALRGMFRPIATAGAVAVVFREPQDVPPMYSDNQKVAQILRNFISNAYKFTEEGTITVSARREADGWVRFSVADTGIGIAPEDLGHLFEDFVQLASARSRNQRGTGLGLSLCRRFAELLGGRVEVESTPGVGSTFHAVLPSLSPADPGAFAEAVA